MFPIIIILIFISLAFAYYFKEKARIKREKSHARFEEKQEELLERLRKQDEKQS